MTARKIVAGTIPKLRLRLPPGRQRTDEGRGKTDEGRGTREEGRQTTDEGRRKRDGFEEGPEISHIFFNLVLAICSAFDYAFRYAASVWFLLYNINRAAGILS
jgi:hypothetical protein